MEIYSKLLELNARFSWLIDHQQGEGISELFIKDGIYGLGAMQAIGREQIDGFYRMRKARGARQSRHLFSNPVILEQTDTTILASCVLTLFAFDGDGPHPAEVHMVADYHDEYQLVGDIWYYKSRMIKPVFGHVPNLTANQTA